MLQSLSTFSSVSDNSNKNNESIQKIYTVIVADVSCNNHRNNSEEIPERAHACELRKESGHSNSATEDLNDGNPCRDHDEKHRQRH